MKHIKWIVPTLALIALGLAGCSSQNVTTTTVSQAATNANLPVAAPTTANLVTPETGSIAGLETTLEDIYSQVNPSVVTINVDLQSTTNSFFGFGGGSGSSTSSAQGSGFVWDNQGDIVTNNHVVAGATRITVTFDDGTTVVASVVGTDPDSDLAVINVKTSAAELKPVTMGDSTQLKVGQLAVAIGNPFGLQGSLTVGFISALGRTIPADENATGPTYSIADMIQIDTPINPGNSGGVLLDDTGSVIGITQSIDTNSGGSSGVGFAIPSAIVQQVVPSLIKSGNYDHPYLGISVVSLDPDLAAAMNLSSSQRGALVEAVTAGGPADKAGVKASQAQTTIAGQPMTVGGDVITAFNGQPVNSSDDLVTLTSSCQVGQTVTLTVLRGGQQIQLKATIGQRPPSAT